MANLKHSGSGDNVAGDKTTNVSFKWNKKVVILIITLIGILLGGVGFMKFKEHKGKQVDLEQKRFAEKMKKYKKDLAEWESFSPKTISENSLDIKGGYAFDMETGNKTNHTRESKSLDLLFFCAPGGIEILRALNGTLWKEIGMQKFNNISYKAIYESNFGSRKHKSGYTDLFNTHKSNVPGEGFIYLIRTADGNIGKLQIQDYRFADENNKNPEICWETKIQYQIFPRVNYPPKPQPPK